MLEARDRIERPVDYSMIFVNRRSHGVLLDEPVQKLQEPGSISQRSLVVSGNFSSWRPSNGSGNIPFKSSQGRENMYMVSTKRGRGFASPSVLPSWYPRTPLRDITHIIQAIERRRAAKMGESGEIEIPIHQQVNDFGTPVHKCSVVTQEVSSMGLKRSCPSSTAKVQKLLLAITKEISKEEEEAGFITPEKKLLNSIDIVEKIVMKEMQKLKCTPLAKRDEREKRVRTLMSMR